MVWFERKDAAPSPGRHLAQLRHDDLDGEAAPKVEVCRGVDENRHLFVLSSDVHGGVGH